MDNIRGHKSDKEEDRVDLRVVATLSHLARPAVVINFNTNYE